jgi:hypothetical protein
MDEHIHLDYRRIIPTKHTEGNTEGFRGRHSRKGDVKAIETLTPKDTDVSLEAEPTKLHWTNHTKPTCYCSVPFIALWNQARVTKLPFLI